MLITAVFFEFFGSVPTVYFQGSVSERGGCIYFGDVAILVSQLIVRTYAYSRRVWKGGSQ